LAAASILSVVRFPRLVMGFCSSRALMYSDVDNAGTPSAGGYYVMAVILPKIPCYIYTSGRLA